MVSLSCRTPEVLSGSSDARRDLVLVEGVFDFHQLRAHGFDGVAALGGTGARAELFERLASLGVETVTLCLDKRRSRARSDSAHG
jgi:DNA primase